MSGIYLSTTLRDMQRRLDWDINKARYPKAVLLNVFRLGNRLTPSPERTAEEEYSSVDT